MDYDLKKLKMLAQGGEADIYDVGDGKILRVIRQAGRKPLDTDKILYPLLCSNHVDVPEIYDYSEVDGKAAQVMQNIRGGSMLEFLGRHPLGIKSTVKKLAMIHSGILNIEAGDTLLTIQGRVSFVRSKPLQLERQLADFALELLKELPEKNNICHGDFHPGNILMQDGKSYVIDWSGAYRGNPLSDVAHSYLLMKLVPKIPGQSSLRHSLYSFVGSFVAKRYLNEMKKHAEFDFSEFSRWTVVMSFFRVYYGLPSEKQDRIDYIRKCYELNSQGKSAGLWYKNI